MKRFSLFILLLSVVLSVHAQYSTVDRLRNQATTNPPLKIGVGLFAPPFEMESSPKVLYGFDITLMQYICKSLQRSCQFIPLRFTKLLAAVENNEIDAAIGAITITAERSERVNFTSAYLPSTSHLIGPAKMAEQPFNLNMLNGLHFGVEEGSVFSKQIAEMGIKNPKLTPFDTEDSLIEALNAGDVDIALMDASTAQYWSNHSADVLKVIGPVFPYGFGYGIAVNKNNIDLLKSFNAKITEFQQSKGFSEAYHMYFSTF
jgi:polar amino acid transport system substrate-binding protein